MSNVLKLQAYKRNQLTTTDSATALLMLYQGTIDSLNRAQASMAAGDMADKGREILRANDIINQFLVSLDYEIGGALINNLEALYLYMLEQILLANAKNDPAPLIVVVSLLSTLKAGWEEAIATQRKQVAQGKP
ncbi:MAG TPA: flagellar export chaperone FliS [Candidatus Saccharimonadales bacterium]|nr:flagellar export chaperone FliS [Candidatus Saccharimonadales bacterium]